jgi:hypothetical protein
MIPKNRGLFRQNHASRTKALSEIAFSGKHHLTQIQDKKMPR